MRKAERGERRCFVIGFDSAHVDFYTPILLGPGVRGSVTPGLVAWLRRVTPSFASWPCLYVDADMRLGWVEVLFAPRDERGSDIALYAETDGGTLLSATPGGGKMTFSFRSREEFSFSLVIGMNLTLRVFAAREKDALHLSMGVMNDEGSPPDSACSDFVDLMMRRDGDAASAEARISRPELAEEWLPLVFAIALRGRLAAGVFSPQAAEEILGALERGEAPRDPFGPAS